MDFRHGQTETADRAAAVNEEGLKCLFRAGAVIQHINVQKCSAVSFHSCYLLRVHLCYLPLLYVISSAQMLPGNKDKTHMHPSIIHHRLVPSKVMRICWSLYQLSLGKRQGYILDRSHVHKQPCTLTVTPTGSLEPPNMHVFGLWEEA